MITKIKLQSKYKAVVTVALIAAVLGLGNYGVKQYQSTQQLKKLRQLITSQFRLDLQTKIASCHASNAMPDHACTPGAIFTSVTKAQVCTSGYSSTVRNVPESEKNQAYNEYGITSHTTGQYEVDHFISLELGGSNDIANLWPEAASPTPGFHQKDEVENFLHSKLCAGQISLPEAQYFISSKWLEVYTLIHS